MLKFEPVRDRPQALGRFDVGQAGCETRLQRQEGGWSYVLGKNLHPYMIPCG